MERLGVLGGTFDPPHYGHLALAENAYHQLALDRVLFAVAGQPPLKDSVALTPVEHRLAMTELATAGNPAFALSRVDVERAGPHYTVDALSLLHEAHPGAELYFLIGSDSLANLLAWHDPRGVIRQAALAVMRRPGYEPDPEGLAQALPGIEERLVWLDVPCCDISSTDLRRRVREGLPLRYLVPLAVEAHIRNNNLYTGVTA